MNQETPRYHPPLRWTPETARVRGAAGASCDPLAGEPDVYSVPRACVPEGSPIFAALLRASEIERAVAVATFTEALCLIATTGTAEREARDADARASVEAIAAAHDYERSALAQDARVAVGALNKLVDEVVRFEARCQAGEMREAMRRMRAVAAALLGRVTAKEAA